MILAVLLACIAALLWLLTRRAVEPVYSDVLTTGAIVTAGGAVVALILAVDWWDTLALAHVAAWRVLSLLIVDTNSWAGAASLLAVVAGGLGYLAVDRRRGR